MNQQVVGTEHEFGEEWWRYSEILPEHEEQFQTWIHPVNVSDFQGKSVLDAGCGMGRNSYWALKYGAARLVAFDYDTRTVEAARQNLRVFPQARVEHCSIYSVPYEDEFDVVFCIGVLHHLADPARAVAQLVKALKPGGKLILWVYGREGMPILLSSILVARWLTRGWPTGALIGLSRGVSVVLKLLMAFPWQAPYLRFLQSISRRHIEAIVLDQLLPSIANYWTREEATALLKDVPIKQVNVHHARTMSWTLVGEKQ